jgi:hypothetical protein
MEGRKSLNGASDETMNAETIEAGRQLNEIAALVEAAAAVEELRPHYYRVNTIARNLAGDEAAMQAASRILSRIVERGNELCRESLVPVRNWQDEKPRAEPPVAAVPFEAAPVSDTLALIPVESQQPEIHRPVIDIHVDRRTAVNSVPRASKSFKRPPAWLIAFGGTLMGMSMVVGLIRMVLPKAEATAKPPEEVAPAPAAPVLLPYLHVQSDLEGGHVLIDGKLAGPLENGEFHLRDLPAGEYLVSVVSGVHQADFEFKVGVDGSPQWKSAPASPSMLALGFACAAGKGFLVSSKSGGIASLDDSPGVPLAAEGVTVGPVSGGLHQLDFADASGTRRFQWKLESASGVHLLLRASESTGGILALTGEDGAEVLLNGKVWRGKSADGRVRIPRIAPGEYLLVSRKTGFVPSPERLVFVRRGQDTRVSLPLRPRPGIQ